MANKEKRTPRVAVTLSPESMKILDSLAALMDRPKASIIAELIDEALPALQVAVEALTVVAEQPREAQRLMANLVAKSQLEIAQEQLALDEALDGRTVKGKWARKRGKYGTP